MMLAQDRLRYKMKYVELTKLSSAKGAKHRAASWDEYKLSTSNDNLSLPSGYILTGFLIDQPKVGRCLRVLRDCRNGIMVDGIFESSPVTFIAGCEVTTENSIYRLRYTNCESAAP